MSGQEFENQYMMCPKGHSTIVDKAGKQNCPQCGLAFLAQERTARPARDSAPGRQETRRFDSGGFQHGPKPTVAVWRKTMGIDPIVGWLVCNEGGNLGRDYRIHSGLNHIGRDTVNQICIAGDDTISSLKHASIFYDAKKQDFYVSLVDGLAGVYVNDTVVLQPTLLQAYDVIAIGQTKLVFVPFCVPNVFRWDDSASDAS